MAYGSVLGQIPKTTEVKFVTQNIPVLDIGFSLNNKVNMQFSNVYYDNFSSNNKITFYWTNKVEYDYFNLSYVEAEYKNERVIWGEINSKTVKKATKDSASYSLYLRNNQIYMASSQSNSNLFYLDVANLEDPSPTMQNIVKDKYSTTTGVYTTRIAYQGIFYFQEGSSNFTSGLKYYDFESKSIKKTKPINFPYVGSVKIFSDKNGILVFSERNGLTNLVTYVNLKNNTVKEITPPEGEGSFKYFSVDKNNYFPDNKITIPLSAGNSNESILTKCLVYDSETNQIIKLVSENTLLRSSFAFGKHFMIPVNYPSDSELYIAVLDNNESVIFRKIDRNIKREYSIISTGSMIHPFGDNIYNLYDVGISYLLSYKKFNNIQINGQNLIASKFAKENLEHDILNKVVIDSNILNVSPSYNWYIALNNSLAQSTSHSIWLKYITKGDIL